MALRQILKIGNELLRKKSESIPLAEIRSKEIKKLIRDMFETMEEANGLGLAAPQIGVLKQVIVIGFDHSERYPEVEKKIERQILINPEIKVLTKETSGYWEGCLSVPDMKGYVERPNKIHIKWYDENEELHEKTTDSFDATIYQHEYDHLQGILYVDRLKDTRLFGYSDEWEKRNYS